MTDTSSFTGVNTQVKVNDFTELNPNPILQLNLKHEVTYLNLASRAWFPTLPQLGVKHPVLKDIEEKLDILVKTKGDFVVFTRELKYLNRFYEQQIFTILIKDSIYIYIRDITQQKQLEQQLKRSQELEEENKLIQEKNRLKSEFLANLSHELRTPLNAIIGFSELLHDEGLGGLNEQQKDALNDVITSGKNLHHLINDLLDITSIEASKMIFSPKTINLQELVDEVISNLSSQVAEKQIKLSFVKDKTQPTAYLDPARFKQVVYNYLSNAIKFTENQGRVQIRLKLEPEKHFRLEVEDSGKPLAVEDLKKLFLEFQQLDSSTAKKYSGIGLGLAITKYIVETQGGEVGAMGIPGKGNIFYAILPLQYLEK